MSHAGRDQYFKPISLNQEVVKGSPFTTGFMYRSEKLSDVLKVKRQKQLHPHFFLPALLEVVVNDEMMKSQLTKM